MVCDYDDLLAWRPVKVTMTACVSRGHNKLFDSRLCSELFRLVMWICTFFLVVN